MTTVQQTITETLVGTTREPQLSRQTRTTFDSHARRDGDDGELYMLEEDFVDAIAPKTENYVSNQPIMRPLRAFEKPQG